MKYATFRYDTVEVENGLKLPVGCMVEQQNRKPSRAGTAFFGRGGQGDASPNIFAYSRDV